MAFYTIRPYAKKIQTPQDLVEFEWEKKKVNTTRKVCTPEDVKRMKKKYGA